MQSYQGLPAEVVWFFNKKQRMQRDKNNLNSALKPSSCDVLALSELCFLLSNKEKYFFKKNTQIRVTHFCVFVFFLISSGRKKKHNCLSRYLDRLLTACCSVCSAHAEQQQQFPRSNVSRPGGAKCSFSALPLYNAYQRGHYSHDSALR